MSEVTRILSAVEHGDPQAAERLLPLVYDELRKLAAQKLAHEKPGQTLEATALVHEAYLRLVAGSASDRTNDRTSDRTSDRANDRTNDSKWDDRGHFFAAAAEAMRRILVENARRKRSLKHGGGLVRHDANVVQPPAPAPSEDLVALDDALNKLAELDRVKAEVVKLRYFAGMTIEETAQALGISAATAKRYWSYARAWLFQEISGNSADSR